MTKEVLNLIVGINKIIWILRKKARVHDIYVCTYTYIYICIRIYTLLLVSMMFLLESSLFKVLDYIDDRDVNHPCQNFVSFCIITYMLKIFSNYYHMRSQKMVYPQVFLFYRNGALHKNVIFEMRQICTRLFIMKIYLKPYIYYRCTFSLMISLREIKHQTLNLKVVAKLCLMK